MDGKLDYKEGTVLMNHPANSVYQQVGHVLTHEDRARHQADTVIQVIERTKGSFFRTSVLRYVYLHFPRANIVIIDLVQRCCRQMI